jgi:hypothetical protein
MLCPTIHLNGSSPKYLYEAAVETRRAVEDALEKLRAVVPNGRDYYPQGPDAINTAQEQYWAMRQKLQEVSDELLEHAGNIVDVAGARLVS